jgi:hypothetical protein
LIIPALKCALYYGDVGFNVGPAAGTLTSEVLPGSYSWSLYRRTKDANVRKA